MTVLSIQSSVSFGYVGNSVAIPTLQKLGHDCWYIHTVYFSNHPGHEQFSGEFATPNSINKKIQNIQKSQKSKNAKLQSSKNLTNPKIQSFKNPKTQRPHKHRVSLVYSATTVACSQPPSSMSNSSAHHAHTLKRRLHCREVVSLILQTSVQMVL